MIRLLIIFLLIPTVAAYKPPSEYQLGQCELIVNDLIKEGGGHRVFISPVDSNGARISGDMAGHWILSKTIHGKTYYIDYKSETIMNSKEKVKQWYKEISGLDSEVYDLALETAPFPIHYRY